MFSASVDIHFLIVTAANLANFKIKHYRPSWLSVVFLEYNEDRLFVNRSLIIFLIKMEHHHLKALKAQGLVVEQAQRNPPQHHPNTHHNPLCIMSDAHQIYRTGR